MYKILLTIVIIVQFLEKGSTFTIQPIEFELEDEKFRLSLPSK